MGPVQVDIRWEDCVGKPHFVGADDERPRPALLRGRAWLIEETETYVVVAAYIADDGGTMDQIAIPRGAVRSMEKAAK